MKKLLIVFVMVLSLCACSKEKDVEKFSYTKVDNGEMLKLMEDYDYTIIDVRLKEEYSEQHIKGAINIPHEEISDAIIPNTEILFVYCQSGGRSKIATETLIALGYKVYDLGGIDEIDLEKE